MLKKLASVNNFIGANVGLAISLTFDYLFALIPHYPHVLRRVVDVLIVLFAWGVVVYRGLDFAKPLGYLFSGKIQFRGVHRITKIIALCVCVVWVFQLNFVSYVAGMSLVGLWYVLIVFSLILASRIAGGATVLRETERDEDYERLRALSRELGSTMTEDVGTTIDDWYKEYDRVLHAKGRGAYYELFRAKARELGSTMPEEEGTTLFDWHEEYYRLHWRDKARVLGSTMADKGTTRSDWEKEESRLYWRKAARELGSTMVDQETTCSGWIEEFDRLNRGV